MRVLTAADAPPNASSKQSSEETMAWKKPRIVEVPLGAEINMYVCAELKR